MTDDKIAAIRERLDALPLLSEALLRVWDPPEDARLPDEDGLHVVEVYSNDADDHTTIAMGLDPRTAEFIAHAPQDIAALLPLAEAAKKMIAMLAEDALVNVTPEDAPAMLSAALESWRQAREEAHLHAAKAAVVDRAEAEVARLKSSATLAPETAELLRTRAAYPASGGWVTTDIVDVHLAASRAWVDAGCPNLPEETP